MEVSLIHVIRIRHIVPMIPSIPLCRTVPVWLLWIKYISFFYYSFNVLMINQWSSIEEISCAPVGSADDTGAPGGSLGYYTSWLALGVVGNLKSSGQELLSQEHSLPCISSGQQVLEQFNIHQVILVVGDRDLTGQGHTI